MYLNDQHRRTPTLISTEWNQSSSPPPRFALVENCGFLNCLHRFLFLSRRRSKKLITAPTGYTTSPCRFPLLPRLNRSFFFFRPGLFVFFLPRENFLVSTFLLVSCLSWPSKEDTASHMALTQQHRLQINGELNTR